MRDSRGFGQAALDGQHDDVVFECASISPVVQDGHLHPLVLSQRAVRALNLLTIGQVALHKGNGKEDNN